MLNYWNQPVPRDREHAREIRFALREAQAREKAAREKEVAKEKSSETPTVKMAAVTEGTFVNPAVQQWWAGALPSITLPNIVIPNFKLP